MTTAASSSSKRSRAANVCANAMLLAGLALACWGVFQASRASGLIVSGIMLIVLARAIAPEK